MLIDLTQLRTFVAVAEEQHLTRAAERIHVSQSAASAHVRAVEDALNTQLFVRTNRSLELTRAGELLFQRAKALLGEAVGLSAFAREISGKTEGQLCIGINGDPSGAKIGEITCKLRENHPLIKIQIVTRPSPGIKQGLKNGEIDIGIFLDRPTDSNLQYHKINTIKFSIVAPYSWKERIANLDKKEISVLPWITPANNSTAYSSILDSIFTENGYPLNSVAVFDSAAVAAALVEAGVGIALLREEAALAGEKQQKFCISAIETNSYDNFIGHIKSRKNDPLILAFIEAARFAWPNINLP